MSGDQKSKNFFSIIVIIILIFFIYLYVKNNFSIFDENSLSVIGENPLVKIIALGAAIFIAYFILKSFVKMLSKNV